MHPEDIKASLRKAHSSGAAIARELQVSKTTVHLVIHGRTISARIARCICERAGLDPERAWPGRYPDLKIAKNTLKRASTHVLDPANAALTRHLESDKSIKSSSNTSTSRHLKTRHAHTVEAA